MPPVIPTRWGPAHPIQSARSSAKEGLFCCPVLRNMGQTVDRQYVLSEEALQYCLTSFRPHIVFWYKSPYVESIWSPYGVHMESIWSSYGISGSGTGFSLR
jgi:hypothetical protein